MMPKRSLPGVSHFDDPAFLGEVISQIGFGALITHADTAQTDAQNGAGFEISHIPVVVKQEGAQVFLEAHVARANPHWKLAEQGQSIFMFQGPQSYVTPSFYPSKQEHGRAVPTWNYITVHAHGAFEVVQDAAWLHQHLHDLSDKHERGRAEPWSINDAPVAYLAALKRGIVGIRFKVEQFEGRWKVNQFKSDSDRQGTIEGLMQEGEQGRDLAETLASFPKAGD
jgi:transcriptional regulator